MPVIAMADKIQKETNQNKTKDPLYLIMILVMTPQD